MNFNANEKNENKLELAKNQSSEKNNETANSNIGKLASILSFITALIAVIILFIGAPLVKRKSGGIINGPGFGNFHDLWDRKAWNIYSDDELMLVAILIAIFTIISGIIALLRKNKRPNNLDILGIFFSILNLVTIIITSFVSFYDNTKYTSGGGWGVLHGSEQQPSFWFVIIAILIICSLVLIIKSYTWRKND